MDLSTTIHLLGELLGDVLRTQESVDLVNLAEESQRIQALRERERTRDRAPIAESIGDAVARLAAAGVTTDRMAAVLGALRIELVLTAHPTEAKRRTVLSKLQRIGETVGRLHGPGLLPRERAAADGEIEAAKREDQADAIVLGRAGMAGLAAELSRRHELPVVDGVAAAVMLVESLARLGLATSKRGGYASPLPKWVMGFDRLSRPR